MCTQFVTTATRKRLNAYLLDMPGVDTDHIGEGATHYACSSRNTEGLACCVCVPHLTCEYGEGGTRGADTDNRLPDA